MILLKSLEISLMILAIHISMWEGMIFSKLRIWLSKILDKSKKTEWVKKPLFDCLMCMGGIWTALLYLLLYGYDIDLFKSILIVIGINSILDSIVGGMRYESK